MLILRNSVALLIVYMFLLSVVLGGCGADRADFDAPRAYMPAADTYSRARDQMMAGNWDGAIPLLNEAAEKGNAQAKYQLGLLYALGEDVAKDLDKARELFLDAGRHGYAKAQYQLGHIYGTGDGVERNYQESFIWFWLASSYGDNSAKRYMRVVMPKLTATEYQDAEVRMKQLWDQMPPESKKDLAAQTSAMH